MGGWLGGWLEKLEIMLPQPNLNWEWAELGNNKEINREATSLYKIYIILVHLLPVDYKGNAQLSVLRQNIAWCIGLLCVILYHMSSIKTFIAKMGIKSRAIYMVR